jgi:hypothetical protein
MTLVVVRNRNPDGCDLAWMPQVAREECVVKRSILLSLVLSALLSACAGTQNAAPSAPDNYPSPGACLDCKR